MRSNLILFVLVVVLVNQNFIGDEGRARARRRVRWLLYLLDINIFIVIPAKAAIPDKWENSAFYEFINLERLALTNPMAESGR